MSNIPSLFPELIAEIYSYLEPKDRSNGLLVCKLFQKTLDSPKYDHKLWPRDRLRLISEEDAKIPLVKRVFHRLLLGKGVPKILGSLTPCGCWPQLVIRDNLLVALSGLGETKVWNMEKAPPLCNHTIQLLLDRHVQSTVLGNWIIRQFHKHVAGREFLNHVEVWTLDQDGRMQEIFSQEFGEPLGDSFKPHLITTVRLRNSFYLAHNWSRDVHVWSLENQSFSHKCIRSDLSFGQVKKLKQITKGELLVMYDRGAMLLDLENDGLKELPIAPVSYVIGRYGAICREDGSMEKIVDLSTGANETSISLYNSRGHMLRKPFAIDGDWLAVGTENPRIGVFLYNLKAAKDNQLSEFAFIPLKLVHYWQWNDWPFLLEWPFFVHAGHDDSCAYVYCLWDLKKNDENEAVPSYTIELPENCKVASIRKHGTSLYVATKDHQIWKIC